MTFSFFLYLNSPELRSRANPVALTGFYDPARFSDVEISAQESRKIHSPDAPQFPGAAFLAWVHDLDNLNSVKYDPQAEYLSHSRDHYQDALCFAARQRTWHPLKQSYRVRESGESILRDWDPDRILAILSNELTLKF